MLGGSGQNGQYDWPATPKEWHFQSRVREVMSIRQGTTNIVIGIR